MKFSRTLLAAAGGLAFLGFQGEAFAIPGGLIVFGPLPAGDVIPAPTLSEWGVAGLAVLIAVIAYRHLRANLGGKPLASFFIAGALGLCGVFGDQVIRQAAALIPVISITNPAGGTVRVCSSATQSLSNATSVILQVVSITPDAGSSIEGGNCAPGLVLPPNASCTLMFTGDSAICNSA